jgi:hypothetical protein
MVSPAAPVWDGKAVPGTDNDFTFDGTGGIAGLVSVDELNRCVKAGSDTVTPGAGDTFSVTFNLAQLVPLIEAEGNALTLQGYTVQLLPRDGTGQGNFTPVPFTASGFTPGVPMASPTAITFTNTGDLPGDDVDGLLDFELTYHAFGAPASGGNKWLIRNGLTFAEDTQSNSGGRFIVQIGAGTL